MFLSIELILLILITLLFINQIVIILEKEKLEDEIIIALKIMNKKPLTEKERKVDDRQWLEPPDNEPKKVFECDLCRDDICEGEKYFEVDDKNYCDDCVFEETAELPGVEAYFADLENDEINL